MDPIQVRQARPNDAETIIELIRELATYEKAAHEMVLTAGQLIADAFGKSPACLIHVAELNGKVLGMALFYPTYSTWKGKMIYLEDLVVFEAYRNMGLGTALLNSVLNFGKTNGAVLVKWQVLDWNQPAIDFYKKYPVEFDDEWVNCKIFTKDIE